MDLVVDTFLLRPYVFAFLVFFLLAASSDLGWRRTLGFGGCVWSVAWLSEFSSTRVGIPFGHYQYTGLTRGRELYIADVPFVDSLSFTFLAYAAFCLARAALGGRAPSTWTLSLTTGGLMMALDVVIDPLAVRGDRWFLGHIFTYTAPGVYFGVPLSNFVGWVIVGTVGVGLYLWLVPGRLVGMVWPGMALYYGVLGFNLAVTMWIGEWLMAGVGAALHLAIAVAIWRIPRIVTTQGIPENRGVRRA